MWNDNDDIMVLFDMFGEGKTYFPCECPVCKKHTAHIYIHRHNDKHCGVWTWCSSCGAYSHVSAKTPLWWENPDFIDDACLSSVPDYLESMAEKIDAWVTTHASSAPTIQRAPFVMKHRFNVRFKKGYNDISKGATGVICISDDFKAVKVDFVNADGKKYKLDIQPEALIEIIEVLS